MLLSDGQMSDYKGAVLMLDALLPAKSLLVDRGYDASWFRNTLADRGIVACIPSKTNHKVPVDHDRALCRQPDLIGNMLGKLKDWRRIHTATADARTPSSQPPASQPPSSSGSINES
jgi:transposase